MKDFPVGCGNFARATIVDKRKREQTSQCVVVSTVENEYPFEKYSAHEEHFIEPHDAQKQKLIRSTVP